MKPKSYDKSPTSWREAAELLKRQRTRSQKSKHTPPIEAITKLLKDKK